MFPHWSRRSYNSLDRAFYRWKCFDCDNKCTTTFCDLWRDETANTTGLKAGGTASGLAAIARAVRGRMRRGAAHRDAAIVAACTWESGCCQRHPRAHACRRGRRAHARGARAATHELQGGESS